MKDCILRLLCKTKIKTFRLNWRSWLCSTYSTGLWWAFRLLEEITQTHLMPRIVWFFRKTELRIVWVKCLCFNELAKNKKVTQFIYYFYKICDLNSSSFLIWNWFLFKDYINDECSFLVCSCCYSILFTLVYRYRYKKFVNMSIFDDNYDSKDLPIYCICRSSDCNRFMMWVQTSIQNVLIYFSLNRFN